MCRKTTDNRGIAIAPILFVIALLAILATAISAGSGTFNAGTDHEKAAVLAKTIIDRAVQYRMAVQRLLAQGCSEMQISFYSTNMGYQGSHSGAYINPNAPADHHCDIFHINGAGGLDPSVPEDWGDFAAEGFHPNVHFRCGGAVPGIGSEKPEVTYFVQDLNKKICDEINRTLGWNGDPPSTTTSNYYCNGSFDDTLPYSYSTFPTSITGRMDLCWQVNSSQRYHFFSVLLPR